MPALMTHFTVSETREFAAELTRLSATSPEIKIYGSSEIKAGNS